MISDKKILVLGISGGICRAAIWKTNKHLLLENWMCLMCKLLTMDFLNAIFTE